MIYVCCWLLCTIIMNYLRFEVFSRYHHHHHLSVSQKTYSILICVCVCVSCSHIQNKLYTFQARRQRQHIRTQCRHIKTTNDKMMIWNFNQQKKQLTHLIFCTYNDRFKYKNKSTLLCDGSTYIIASLRQPNARRHFSYYFWWIFKNVWFPKNPEFFVFSRRNFHTTNFRV